MATYKCIKCGMNVQSYQDSSQLYKACPACGDAAVIQDSGDGIFLCKTCNDFVLVKNWPHSDKRLTITHEKCGGPATRVN